MNIAQLTAELDHCNKCGFCMAGCPTYQTDPMEWLVARGRISLVQDLLAGRLDPADPGFRQAIDSCLMCRSCVAHCPSRVQTDFVITRAKAARRLAAGFTWPERLIYRGLLPRPRLLQAVVRAAGQADRLGLRRWALRTGLLARWPVLKRAAETGPPIPAATGRELIARAVRADPPQGADQKTQKLAPRDRVVYFLGCSKNLLYPEAALSTYRVLRTNHVAVEVPEVACCGLPTLSAGDLEGARALAVRNLAILEAIPDVPIVVDEGSCGAHLTHMSDLFAGQPEEAALKRLGARIVDLSVYLDRLGIDPLGEVTARVVWHDPCHLRHHLGVTEAPRRLLAQVPGTTVVEPVTDSGCCGGAGAFMLTQPDLSDKLLAGRLAAVRAVGADFLVTGSPSCVTQFARATGGPPVLYLSQYLDLAYQARESKKQVEGGVSHGSA
ncbi:MAG TPA: (Fe-S)-binding protein [Symbiobacteriaceae bacterium]|jgi:glycolate oxidase iron-sulfur subunit